MPRGSVRAPQSRSQRVSKRKRHTNEQAESELQNDPSTTADGSVDFEENENKTSKRACNECRQQKLRCDVVQDPFTKCTRCKKLEIDCRIDSNFRRIAGKRNKTLELQREVDELRRQLALRDQQSIIALTPPNTEAIAQSRSAPIPQGGYTLENVVLSEGEVITLFADFFHHYHPCFPLLDSNKDHIYYFSLCPLLGWAIISVACRRSSHRPDLLTELRLPLQNLLWATMAQNLRTYHVVKALCLICTWPMPVSTNSDDTVYLTSGVMMQLAIQAGLHQPKHAQDFAKFAPVPTESVLKDRHLTWVFCNIAAQNASTMYGQPPMTLYDWSLGLGTINEECYKLNNELQIRLQIGRIFDKITKTLYNNASYPTNLNSGLEQQSALNLLRRECQDLEILLGQNISSNNRLRLRAASVHLHSFAFHIPLDSSIYHQQMSYLYQAVVGYIQSVLDYETETEDFLKYCTQFPFQMLLSATSALLRILNSLFAENIDQNHGRTLFNSAILAIRRTSIQSNDVPDRVAGNLSRMWRALGSGGLGTATFTGNPDEVLQLTIRSRMSMSHVFDTVWVWKMRFLARERSNGNDTITAVDPPPLVPVSSALTTGSLPEPLFNFSFDSLDFLNSMDWVMDDFGNTSW